MDANRQRSVPQLGQRPIVDLDVRLEPPRIAADDGQRQREAVPRGPHHRLRTAADSNPGRERRALHRRKDPDAVERRTHRSLPLYRLPGMVGVPEGREDRQLLLEQDLVVVQRIAEQGKRLGERATSQNDLGSSVGNGVQGAEALIDPNGVVGAEHGDGGAELHPLGAAGDGREQHLGGADREIRAMVLAHAEEVHADPVGQLGFGNDVPEDARMGQKAATGVRGDVAEGVQAQFDGCHSGLTGG